MYSLNQIKKVLEDIATNHKQINSFGFGDIWEYTAKPQVHPIMWAELKESNITVTEKQLFLSFSLYFMDLVNKDERNETEVLSDQLFTATDVISLLWSQTYEDVFFFGADVQLTPFTEAHDDEVSGWKCDVTFRIPYLRDTCYIPSSSIPPITGDDFVRIIDQDGNVIANVPCGGAYSVLVFSGIDGGNATTVYTNSIVNP